MFEAVQVFLGHPLGRKPLLKYPSDIATIQSVKCANCFDSLCFILHDKPVTPWSTISGIDPRRQAITRVPQAIASITTSPNGSGQSIGKRRAAAFPRKSAFAA
jgi:hypothetical protein